MTLDQLEKAKKLKEEIRTHKTGLKCMICGKDIEVFNDYLPGDSYGEGWPSYNLTCSGDCELYILVEAVSLQKIDEYLNEKVKGE